MQGAVSAGLSYSAGIFITTSNCKVRRGFEQELLPVFCLKCPLREHEMFRVRSAGDFQVDRDVLLAFAPTPLGLSAPIMHCTAQGSLAIEKNVWSSSSSD